MCIWDATVVDFFDTATTRRRPLLAGQVVVLFVFAATLYYGVDHVTGQLRCLSRPLGSAAGGNVHVDSAANAASPASSAVDAAAYENASSIPVSSAGPVTASATAASTTPAASETASTGASDTTADTSTDAAESADGKQSGGGLPANTTALYVQSIMDHTLDDLPKVGCPDLSASSSRYDSLKAPENSSSETAISYFFALNLRDSLELLPQLLGSVVESIRFLGPARCALSITEGNSQDGTYQVLDALRSELDALGTTYYLHSSDIDPKQGDRIAKLAALRNEALQPLKRDANKAQHEKQYSADTTIVFLNDIAACTEDVLELVWQQRALGADMVCALDWAYVGRDPTFYDVWIARGLTGDTFFEIPPDGNWNSAWNLFWNDDRARGRLYAHQPFQVFSCWNGAAVFSARPVLEDGIAFRSVREGECMQGEPQLFCKDLWHAGYGKIAVVPSVSFEYAIDRGQRIKALKGFTSQWTTPEYDANHKIAWQLEPPETVKCIPNDYARQEFRPWNETLGS